jgi:VCBS repeat-containing protein
MPLQYEYNFSFADGPDAWKTWMAPSVQREPGGVIEQYTRLNAPGDLDPNHIDGIGPIWLVSHLSLSDYGAPGRLDLNDSMLEITVRTEDFDANGAQLAIWVIRYLPEEDVIANYYVGLQSTNWAYTGGNFVDQLGDEWSTITVDITGNPSDWTYAGNYVSNQGDWAERYVPYDLDDTLSNLDATLHLVMIGEKPDQAPSGFIDIASIKIMTDTEAVPINTRHYTVVTQTDEDVASSGQLIIPVGINSGSATFSLVAGSVLNGSVVIDPNTGAFIFTPAQDFWGPDRASNVATFKYTVTDGITTSAEQPVLVKVAPINDAPVVYAGTEDVSIVGDADFSNRLRSGTDVDRSERLTFKLVDGSVENGALVLDQDSGAYTFTPNASFVGTASFSYVVSDGQIDAAAKTVSFTVTDPSSPPVLPSFGQVVQDYLIPGDINGFVYWTMLLAENGDVNASYHYGTWLGAGRYVDRNTADAAVFLEVAHGTVPDATLQLAGMYSSGDGVVRDYDVARTYLESLGDDKTARYKIGVLDDLGFGGPVDPESAVNHYIEAAKAGNADAMYTLGRRYLDGSGTDYSADDAYFWLGVGLRLGGGPPIPQFDDLLTFNMNMVRPDLSAERIAELDAAIAAWNPGDTTPVNDAPTADVAVETFSGVAGQTIAGTLLKGDDRDGDDLSFAVVVSSAVGGAITLNAISGAFEFVGTAGFYGPASFRYKFSDGQDSSSEKTVTLDIAAGTDAVDDTATVGESGTFTATQATGLLANDLYTPGSIVQIQGAAAVFGTPLVGSFGSLTVNSDGSYTYVANAGQLVQGQTATDTFTYEIRDASGTMDQATLTITLTGEDGIHITSSGTIFGSAYDDDLKGGVARDVIVGRDGNDRISGGTGAANELYGQLGDDTFVIEAVGDTVVENIGEGIDTVETTLGAYTLGANIENLRYIGPSVFAGTGNGQENQITGGVLNDTLSGLAGNDTLFGSDGDDTLIGGSGNNTLNGGIGQDTADYENAAAGVTAKLNGNVVTDNGNAGIDTLIGIESVAGSAFADLLIGNNLANVLEGRGGADILIGLAGNDTLIADAIAANTMQGGADDDTYVVYHRRDTITEFGNEGVDTVQAHGAVYRLEANLENLVNSSGQAFVGLGNAENNVLTGSTQRDNLFGYGGNDILIGGTGVANTMLGGADDDTYRVSAVGDSIIEYAGEGIDTVETTIATYALRENIENLTYLGTESFSGTGNALNNQILGSTGNDTFRGLGGADVFVFHDNFGDDVVLDFNVDEVGEKLDISEMNDIANFTDLVDNHLQFNAQGNAVITSADGTIELIGVGEGVLTVDHFNFG